MSDNWRVPLFRPTLGVEDEDAVVRVLRSGWLTTGPETAALEQEIAAFTDTEYAVATSSGTHAMQLSLMAAGIGEGCEVITSPITFAATVGAIKDVGATPILADIDPTNGNLCPKATASAITERTRAILPVHLGGHPTDHESFSALADKHGLKIIEDAAHALEVVARRDSFPVDTACFSFYASKNMTTAEGGMLVTNDAAIADRARELRCHGLSRPIADRHHSTTPWSYDINHRGIKANMNDIAAAMGRVQLAQVPKWHEERREIVHRYVDQLRSESAISLPVGLNDLTHAWHLFAIHVSENQPATLRDKLLQFMTSAGIGCSIHFRPIFDLTAYRPLFVDARQYLPQATAWSDRCLSLPLFPTMTSHETQLVIDTLKEAIKSCGGHA